MVERFTTYNDAARALLAIDSLSEKEGQFCGGLAFRASPLSDKQAKWLRVLLDRAGLPLLRKETGNEPG